ncbi:MAG: zinc ribbon domain-containing protein [Anaerolineae bacterium]|jgi:hypothetical protein
MDRQGEEVHLTKLETVLVVGVIGCLLFATWELTHLVADVWLREWVRADRYTHERIIRYGVGLSISITSLLGTTRYAFRFGRFGETVNRAFLWYGTLLLLSTIGWFLLDCLPEVFVGFLGAGLFIATIYVVQKRFFTRERIVRSRMDKGQCPICGVVLHEDSLFCAACGSQVGRRCTDCAAPARIMDRFCWCCGSELSQEPASAQ